MCSRYFKKQKIRLVGSAAPPCSMAGDVTVKHNMKHVKEHMMSTWRQSDFDPSRSVCLNSCENEASVCLYRMVSYWA